MHFGDIGRLTRVPLSMPKISSMVSLVHFGILLTSQIKCWQVELLPRVVGFQDSEDTNVNAKEEYFSVFSNGEPLHYNNIALCLGGNRIAIQ